MTTTTSKQKYLESWNEHVREMVKLYVEIGQSRGLSNPYTFAMEQRDKLYRDVQEAADHLYPWEEADE